MMIERMHIMSEFNHKVVLVGCGAVGSTFAFSLLETTRVVSELVIVDRNQVRAQGNAMDLEDITGWTMPSIVKAGTYADAHDADVVVITAGVPRQPGESRLDLVNKNAKILKSIVDPIVASGFHGIFVVSANPVDILTTLTQQISGFPKSKVIGTGTSLDTARLRIELAHRLSEPVDHVRAYVMGEHGDSSFLAFDEIEVDGHHLSEIPNAGLTRHDIPALEQSVREKGGHIIDKKGATYFGVAECLSLIVRAILENHATVLSVSAPLNGQYGIDNLYLGAPAIINAHGIDFVVEYRLSEVEKKLMEQSADKMREVLKQVSLD